MTAERTKKNDFPRMAAAVENVTLAGDQIVVEWGVDAHGVDRETAGELISNATGGEIISEEQASEIMSRSGSTTFSMGFSRKNKNHAKASWEPTGPKKGPWRDPEEDTPIQ